MKIFVFDTKSVFENLSNFANKSLETLDAVANNTVSIDDIMAEKNNEILENVRSDDRFKARGGSI